MNFIGRCLEIESSSSKNWVQGFSIICIMNLYESKNMTKINNPRKLNTATSYVPKSLSCLKLLNHNLAPLTPKPTSANP